MSALTTNLHFSTRQCKRLIHPMFFTLDLPPDVPVENVLTPGPAIIPPCDPPVDGAPVPPTGAPTEGAGVDCTTGAGDATGAGAVDTTGDGLVALPPETV